MKLQLTRNQFFLFLFVIQTGTVFISFQSLLIREVKTDAWILFIGVTLLHFGILLFYEAFYERFQPGKIIRFIYRAYWVFINISFIAFIEYTLSVWAFPNTPKIIMISIIVIISLYVNLSRVETAVNISVILLPMIPLFFIALFFSWPHFEWTRLLPIYLEDAKQIIIGLIIAQITFVGMESYLFLRKYVNTNEKIKGKPLFIYQIVWFVFFFTTVVFVLAFFSLKEISFISEPIMYMLKSQQVGLVERFDLFFLFIWMTWSIITVALFSFLITRFTFKQRTNKKQQVRMILLYHFVIIAIPPFFSSIEQLDVLRKSLKYIQIIFSFFIPLIVILSHRRKSA